LDKLRNKFIESGVSNIKEEIIFFKEMKPQILGRLLYFNKIYIIELKRPNGSDISLKSYYENELDGLTFFFNRNLDFYQYYRSNSSHLDECYFVRGKHNIRLCVDSCQFNSDPLFSTGYDYKIAKILSNEMLRIYLNKKLQEIDKFPQNENANPQFPRIKHTWTGTKTELVELIYSIHTKGSINHGKIDIKELVDYFCNVFNTDAGDFYRIYINIRNRKDSRTMYLDSLRYNFIKKMETDDNK
jgi:hypothetical protein